METEYHPVSAENDELRQKQADAFVALRCQVMDAMDLLADDTVDAREFGIPAFNLEERLRDYRAVHKAGDALPELILPLVRMLKAGPIVEILPDGTQAWNGFRLEDQEAAYEEAKRVFAAMGKWL